MTATSTGGAVKTSIPDAVSEAEAAKKMSELIKAMEKVRAAFREAHDACEVLGEVARVACRDSGSWPRGWDKIPESRRWRGLGYDAAGGAGDAADAIDALMRRAQRVLADAARQNKERSKMDAAS
jgi:hypothetical protein